MPKYCIEGMTFDIQYSIVTDNGSPFIEFDYASMDGGELDCDALFVRVLDDRYNNALIKNFKFLSLSEYFQQKLTNDTELYDDLKDLGEIKSEPECETPAGRL